MSLGLEALTLIEVMAAVGNEPLTAFNLVQVEPWLVLMDKTPSLEPT